MNDDDLDRLGYWGCIARNDQNVTLSCDLIVRTACLGQLFGRLRGLRFFISRPIVIGHRTHRRKTGSVIVEIQIRAREHSAPHHRSTPLARMLEAES